LEILYKKKFLKDLSNVPSKDRKEIEHFIFEVLPTIKTLAQLGKFEKMSATKIATKQDWAITALVLTTKTIAWI
jgi:hypothetical protein